MTSTRLSNALAEANRRYAALSDEEKAAIKRNAELREQEQLREFRKREIASKVKKAGLLGNYAEADCELGRFIAREALEGRGTFLFGECGRGKTYAAACAARVFIMAGKTAKLITTTKYLNSIQSTWARDYRGGESADDIRKRFSGYDLLVLDDFGVEQSSEFAARELTELLDNRIGALKPIVFTSNVTVGHLSDKYGAIEGKRIASRITGICTRQNLREVTGRDWRLA